MLPTGAPGSKVRFKVIETIRGPVMSGLVLPGYLVDMDDFNDRQPPYNFVRPGGRARNCFADFYRSGGQFLLFLKKDKDGKLTVKWYPLGPVNEQLHSDNDPWLLWTREHAQKPAERVPNSESKPEVGPDSTTFHLWRRAGLSSPPNISAILPFSSLTSLALR